MKLTTKLGLKKPDLTDYVNVGDLNDNMDILDGEVGNLKEGTTEVTDLETLDKTYKGAINEINQEVKTHKTENATIKHMAKEIGLQDTSNNFTAVNVEGAMGELFTNVSNGKQLVGNAITDVDDSVVIPTEPSFNDLADTIGEISTGKKWASNTYNKMPDGDMIVTNLPFTPNIFLIYTTRPASGNYGIWAIRDLKADGNLGIWDGDGSSGTRTFMVSASRFSFTNNGFIITSAWDRNVNAYYPITWFACE